jgi:hypothetical protein
VLVVPLGGWFNTKGQVLHQGVSTTNYHGGLSLVRGWTIKKPREFLEMNKYPQITMVDREGQKITTHVETALLFFKHYFNGGNAFEWRTHLRSMLESIKRLNEENAEFRTHYESAVKLQKGLQRLLDQTIARLDGTRRFIQSKEAQALREWMISELGSILSPEAATEANKSASATTPVKT